MLSNNRVPRTIYFRNSPFFLYLMILLSSCQSDDLIYVSTLNSEGIEKGTSVLISGMSVGTVRTISLEGRTVWLGLAIKPEYPIGDEAEFAISSISLLGERAIIINHSLSGAILQSGDTLRKNSLPQKSIFTEIDSAKVDTLKRRLLKTGEAIIDLLKND